MPLQWRNQFWQSLEKGAVKRCSECASNGLSLGLDDSCGLQKVLRVDLPQLVLPRCSNTGPLLRSCFSVDEGAELYNVLWGLWFCLAWAVLTEYEMSRGEITGKSRKQA